MSGAVATKPATGVTTDVAIVVATDPERPDYVSRGGHKLAGALEVFEPAGLVVRGRRCLDAGASTGGFTDVLLQHGAREVVAVDVGYGQLAWRLRQDERVVVHDRTNVRDLSPDGRAQETVTVWISIGVFGLPSPVPLLSSVPAAATLSIVASPPSSIVPKTV